MGFLDRFRGQSTGDGADREPPARTVDEIVEGAERFGLQRVSAQLRASVWPSLRFDVRPGTAPPASTRVGGAPGLPPDVDWPTWSDEPLIFVAQIAMTDLHGTAVAHLLPPDGVLSFWYAGSDRSWGFDPADEGAARVIHFPAGVDLAERPIPDGLPLDGPLAPCTWSPREELTIPPLESWTVDSWGLSEEEQERYFALQDWLDEGGDPTAHRLLGHPDPIQDDMQLECQLVTNGLYCGDATGYKDPRRESLDAGAAEWRLLLQIDSDAALGSEWGDAGRVYFWVREQDLAARRFDGAWHVMQCT